jgi:hypothetical protein
MPLPSMYQDHQHTITRYVSQPCTKACTKPSTCTIPSINHVPQPVPQQVHQPCTNTCTKQVHQPCTNTCTMYLNHQPCTSTHVPYHVPTMYLNHIPYHSIMPYTIYHKISSMKCLKKKNTKQPRSYTKYMPQPCT